jgi:hypothetical protein
MPRTTRCRLALPAGITVDSIAGSDSSIAESNEPLAISVSNSNSGDTKVTFPAGYVFSPSDAEFEYMMLLKEFSFTATGGGSTFQILPTYGCNQDSLDPADPESYYDLGWRENDKEIQELLDIVASKALNTDDAVDLAQDALTEITSDSGLTAATRDSLKTLP